MVETIEISDEQRDMMNHALGLNYKKKPCRNHSYASSDNEHWNDLVEKGLAVKIEGWEEGKSYYHITYKGAKLVYGKPMSIKYFMGIKI
jgi:hypothetical protein